MILLPIAIACTKRYITVSYDEETNSFKTTEGVWDKMATVRGYFSDESVDKTGVPKLQIESSGIEDSTLIYKAMGVAEAALTKHLLPAAIERQTTYLCSKFLKCPEPNRFPEQIYAHFKENYELSKRNAINNEMNAQIQFIYDQIDGMMEGLEDIVTIEELWTYMGRNEIVNVARFLSSDKRGDKKLDLVKEGVIGDRSGTVLMKISDQKDDVFFAHNTITGYGESLSKISKVYIIDQTKRILFSSPPCQISPIDFCLITGNGIIVNGVQINCKDEAFIDMTYSTTGFPAWIRLLSASTQASDTSTFISQFGYYPTVTATQTVYVCDAKKFGVYRRPRNYFLKAFDEVLGQHTIEDLTGAIEQQPISNVGFPHTTRGKELSGLSGEEDQRLTSTNDLLKEVNSIQVMWNTILNSNGVAPHYEQLGVCKGTIDAQVTSVMRTLHFQWEGKDSPSLLENKEFVFGDWECCTDEDKGSLPDILSKEKELHYMEIDL